MRLKMQSLEQEGVQMYVGTMTINQLLRYAEVDVWRQSDGNETGYQRAPETGRIKKVANYLTKDSRPLMPTSVLLSYRGSLDKVEENSGFVTLEIPDESTLWIVDGQHRIFGFRNAIDEGFERLRSYQLPVVIIEFAKLEDEASQFRVINETMKKVRTDLARRILLLRMGTDGAAGRKELLGVSRLWEAVAGEVIKVLTSDRDSPWFDRIQAPNVRKKPSHAIRELSFSTSLKPILTEYPYRTWSGQQIAHILKAYWRAWRELVPEAFEAPDDFVLLKTPGAFALHQLARHILELLRARGMSNPTVDDFRGILNDLGEYASAEFWKKDNREGAALAGSMKGFGILSDTMIEELTASGHSTV